MTQDSMWDNTLALILGFVIIILVAFSIFYFDLPSKIGNIFPDFTKSNYSSKWEGESYLEHPELAIFFIEGDEANIYFFYDKVEIGRSNWMWKLRKPRLQFEKYYFIPVDATFTKDFRELDSKNQKFVKELIGKSSEEGLLLIVNRVLQNKEGNEISDVKLEIDIDKGYVKKEYDASNAFLRDLDGLIDKINQITRAAIKNKEKKK